MLFITIAIICTILVIAVLGLSIMTINKGYSYKHTVDPLPEEVDKDNDKKDNEKANH
ncbi:YtzI protein [Radiobacillus sp. PE A8.2]|uniref:YtzI protein n=1 Tax=Radiobacillus sp. PE A8.2 TaxID=3380349 RepID=UPI00388E2BF3